LLVLAGLLVPAGAATASGGGGPSAGQVAAARRAAAARAEQVRGIEARIAATERRLAALNRSAERVIEAYDRAQVDLAAATSRANAATLLATTSAHLLAQEQSQVDAYAAAAYMNGAGESVGQLVDASGPAGLVTRMDDLQAIATAQARTVAGLTAAKVYNKVAAAVAAAALSAERVAFGVAATARSRAMAQVRTQVDLLQNLHGQQRELVVALARAQRYARGLAAARAAALARAAAAAAAAAAARAAAQAAASSAASQSWVPAVGPRASDPAGVAVQWAYAELGKPYEWGAAGPNSFDCSGLTMFVYAQAGVVLQHWTGYQWNEGVHVPRDALRRGDLVFFAYDPADSSTIHHVGVYIGNGEMIDAPYTGSVVRFDSVDRPDYAGAVRPY
jgi:cell wall-associated NlpC family hydrolase